MVTVSHDLSKIKIITMVYTMHAQSSGVTSRAGIPRVVLVYSKLYVAVSRTSHISGLHCIQALEYGEIKAMADKAALFKYVTMAGRSAITC